VIIAQIGRTIIPVVELQRAAGHPQDRRKNNGGRASASA